MGHLRHGFSVALVGIGLFASTASVNAQPFGSFDARSAGMGGVGVATGARNASFNNPALLTTASEQHDWVLMAPIMGRQLGDPDNLQDNLEAFQTAADVLDAGPSAANRNAVQASLNAMDDSLYQESGNVAILLAIPSNILSAAAFLNLYDWANAQSNIGGDNLTDPANPQYTSTIDHRGARVLENGITMAKPFNAAGWRKQLALGFNVKLLFVEGYGYSEDVRDAEVSINRSNYSSSADFDVDIGLIKEFGVWKLGLVAKNLFSTSYKYGDSGETFNIAPQLRAGFAYQSRRTVLELDLDLISNEASGFSSESQMAALGLEFKPWHWIALRTGYQQNMIGTQIGTASAGLGLVLGFVTLDVAGSYSEVQTGAFAQLGFQF